MFCPTLGAECNALELVGVMREHGREANVDPEGMKEVCQNLGASFGDEVGLDAFSDTFGDCLFVKRMMIELMFGKDD